MKTCKATIDVQNEDGETAVVAVEYEITPYFKGTMLEPEEPSEAELLGYTVQTQDITVCHEDVEKALLKEWKDGTL